MRNVRSSIQTALARYLLGSDPREQERRSIATRHRVLPILDDWTGFVALREDGTMVLVLDDADPVQISEEITPHLRHIASVIGARRHPELADMMPVADPSWFVCESCRGTGVVEVEGQRMPELVCRCAGLGQLPPEVHEFLQGVTRQS